MINFEDVDLQQKMQDYMKLPNSQERIVSLTLDANAKNVPIPEPMTKEFLLSLIQPNPIIAGWKFDESSWKWYNTNEDR